MKTRNVLCASLAILFAGGLAMFANAQEAKPIIRKPRPISSRSRRSKIVRTVKQPQRVQVDANRVHRFEELFDGDAVSEVFVTATPQQQQPQRDARPQHTPGRFPGLQAGGIQPIATVPTNEVVEQSFAHNETIANPFVDDPESGESVWQLTDVEPMMASVENGDFILGSPNLERTPIPSSPIGRVTTASGQATANQHVQPVAQQREFARWQSADRASSIEENRGGGWVKWKARETIVTQPTVPVDNPPKRISLRRGLKRPMLRSTEYHRQFTNVRSNSQTQDSHWASVDKFGLPAEPEYATEPQRLLPIPAQTVSRTREQVQQAPLDDSWYDDFPKDQPANTTTGTTRTISLSRPLKARPIQSRFNMWQRKTPSRKAQTPQ